MGRSGVLVQREFGPLTSDTRPPKPIPFLKWAGGKGQLLEQMSPYFPERFNTYYEPFLGGGAVFFHLLPPKAVLSDLNPELVNVWQAVRDKPKELMVALDEHHPHRKSKDYFYKVRSQDPKDMDPVERAARTVFLNKTCYNGLYRVNSKGQFNVPFGYYSDPTLYDEDIILASIQALRGKTILVADYRDACKEAQRGDFIYLDPPYHPLSPTSSFTEYTQDSFGDADQMELAAFFRRLDERYCKVMLTNSATNLVRYLYKGFHTETVKANRVINCKAAGRGAISELLIMNYGEP